MTLACRFGEDLDSEVISRAFSALESCDLFVTIGTSSIVWPAAGFAAKVRFIGICCILCPSLICIPVESERVGLGMSAVAREDEQAAKVSKHFACGCLSGPHSSTGACSGKQTGMVAGG